MRSIRRVDVIFLRVPWHQIPIERHDDPRHVDVHGLGNTSDYRLICDSASMEVRHWRVVQ